ncbi:MAG: GAF domain-containing protein, partial [Desulfosarcinaceae bacterium]
MAIKPKTFCDPGFESNPSTGQHHDHSIQKISDLFSLLGSDPEENIRIIVQQTCEMLGSASSLYSRLENDRAYLICWAGCNLPPGFPPGDEAEGHVCYEATLKAGNYPVVIEDLAESSYYHSDPLIKRFGLKSYMGHPVYSGGRVLGSLCVVDTRSRKYSKVETYTMCTLAKAISL